MAKIIYLNQQPFWQDSQGRLIPESQVRPEDQAKDRMIEEIAQSWKEAQANLIHLKRWVYSEVGAYLSVLSSKYGAKSKPPESGLTIKDFSGRFKLQIQVASIISFDEKLQIAKGLIDQCIERWSRNSDPKLVTVIKDAFRVNQQGKISIPRILGLRNLSIDDVDWERAMEAITDSVLIEHTKKYVRLYERDEEAEGGYKALPLDIAAL
ncbi:MAG: hypothetical protein A2508_10315 [Candidatus Lambdaproteobacteria bacterium RIFOXYD12_FULL_49_8]|uniref:Sulfate transporter n=1 Tax=Candidatus Lambdaproteobacteria bacterium RIFOXYD2_FULL_50_16 TaxID=1817772 RepID=A0A1F6G636_9PROT|nr:MAG: hypothetical protein A2527_11750 [Candidatus Lambdaproteobacteria bacterium RIFOXYD2_FULL_50_16]OGG98419.1 MAG: hypothetical protein A2508_10315 [Candidatus Lambdaproteobacteria bacterium RIFOXYD12_FULL_49_8]